MKWFWPALTAGLTVSALRARGRVEALAVLDETDETEEAGVAGYRWVTAPGVVVDGATARAAVRHARARGLEALDLVPGDLPGPRVLALARDLDPTTYAGDAMAAGRTAGQALLVSDGLAERVGVERWTDVDLPGFVALVTDLKHHAPWATDVAVAPGLRSAAVAGDRWEIVRAAVGDAAPNLVGLRAVGLGGLVAGLAGRRPGAIAALAAYQLQPVLATAGTSLHPRDRWRAPLTRTAAAVADVAATVAVRPRRGADPVAAAEMTAKRAAYRRELATGVDHFFEPRRDDCPICGSGDLAVAAVATDMVQGKPGEFRLDRCGACGLVFQNPRLTLEGLDFYYRDFYDGVGAESLDLVFRSARDSYDQRVAIVGRLTEPRRWLDVGTGHGHFCLVAQETWPKAEIDGLDMTDAIDEAARRGWVGTGHRGLFPEVAPSLEGAYDVVSMHHYLEHTRDPGAELDAAATVLAPGGLLSIEVPNPDSAMSRRLKGLWVPFFQPQHQNLLPLGTLEKMLHERGFTTAATEVAEAHQPCDVAGALFMAINGRLPSADVPWAPEPPSTAALAVRNAGLMAAFPLFAVGALADRVLTPILPRIGASSAYRIVARYDGGTAVPTQSSLTARTEV